MVLTASRGPVQKYQNRCCVLVQRLPGHFLLDWREYERRIQTDSNERKRENAFNNNHQQDIENNEKLVPKFKSVGRAAQLHNQRNAQHFNDM